MRDLHGQWCDLCLVQQRRGGGLAAYKAGDREGAAIYKCVWEIVGFYFASNLFTLSI